MKIINGIRFRDEDVERLSGVITKALNPRKQVAETTAAEPVKNRGAAKGSGVEAKQAGRKPDSK